MQRKVSTTLFTSLFVFVSMMTQSTLAQAPSGTSALGSTQAPGNRAVMEDSGSAEDEAIIAESDSTEDETEPDIIPLASAQGASSGSVDSASDDLINVSVENETLENIVNMFTRISGANIVTSSADLEGTVTVNLRGVDWKNALSAILDIHDLALAEQLPGSGVYTIIPKPTQENIPLVVDTIFLHFTTVPDVQPILTSMLASSNSTISAFASRNAIIIRTTDANMRELKQMVETMDVPGEQVVVEAKFVELSDGSSKSIGIDWDMMEGLELALTTAPFGQSKITDKNRYNESSGFNNQSVSSLDTRTRSSISDDGSMKLYDQNGIQYESSSPTTFDHDDNPLTPPLVISNTDPTRTLNSAANDSRIITDISDNANGLASSFLNTFNESVTKAEAAILDVETMNIVISALKRTEGAEIVSNPKIVVASGATDAYFSVGDREPIIRTEIQQGTQDSPGDIIIGELDTTIDTDYINSGYLQTGISLKVIPVVKTEELIEAAIEPRLVEKFGDKFVGLNSWPILSVKEIKTVFTLRSGQTVAIGGLTDTEDDSNVSKVPVLGDIPFLGKYLFSHTVESKRRIETIIFVTLTIADPELLYHEAGIPANSELIHKQMIRSRTKREEFEAQLEQLEKVTNEETSRRARARLLQRTE